MAKTLKSIITSPVRGGPFDLFWGEGGVEDLKNKFPAKPLQSKKNTQHERLLENACTAIKKIPAPLDSEKINSCTNSSTFPHKGQMVHPSVHLFNSS